MILRSIRSLKKLKGKTVLLRADFNVPVTKGRVDATEDFRLSRVVPTIELLLKRGARVIILSHRGRPDGKVREDLRLEPVAKRLRVLLKHNPTLPTPSISPFLRGRTRGGSGGDEEWGVRFHPSLARFFPFYTIVNNRVWMLENLRFDPREETNDATFAKTLAEFGHCYVNDAFAVSHRKNASVHAITKYLPSYAGLLMEDEVHHLSSIWHTPKRPLVVILGGAKISTKIGLIEKFLPHADAVLLGGALANTLLKAQGHETGGSLVEETMLTKLRSFDMTNARLKIPIDIIVAKSVKEKTRIAATADVRAHESIFDIGPDTVQLFSSIVRQARMIVWNGPLGCFEEKQFAKSTFAVLRAALQNKKAKTIIGGGETVTAYRQFEASNKQQAASSKLFLSTGGGAMLEYLEKGMLPGIEPLLRK